jgi:hypothetical protein
MASKKSADQELKQGPQAFELVAPNDLRLDLENPRFTEEKFPSEIDAIQYLYDNADVDELIQSILSAGYVNFEPLVVLRKENIVLEGNRRLAALRLIGDANLRRDLKISLPDIPDPKKLPERINVIYVQDRSAARSFIGFKHINGPHKWDALAKARYAASWLESGGDIGLIGRTLGDNHNTVRRLVNGWYVLRQAQSEGFESKQITKRNFSFSHVYTAFSRPSVREFLGLSEESADAAPRKNPISSENVPNLLILMSWLYGQEQKGEPTIIRSQNPDLNRLVRVLGNTEAKKMLMARRDLDVAYQRVDPASNRFEVALIDAAKMAENAMSLAGHYDGDATLLKVADGLQKTTRSLLVTMRERSDGKDNE